MGRTRRPSALRLLVIATAFVFALLASPASAADNFGDATDDSASDLGLPDSVLFDDNFSATTQSGEPLTPTGPGFCADGSFSTDDGAEMGATQWYLVEGTGGPIVLSTVGSDFDTVLAVYDTDGTGTTGNPPPGETNFLACDDDGGPDGTLESELTFTSASGLNYLVQVGGYDTDGVPDRGDIVIQALTPGEPPANDNRAAAQPAAFSDPMDGDNIGAGTEGGELTNCGGTSFGKTVWYRVSVPSAGRLTLLAQGIDAVISAYAGGSGTPIGCRDDSANSTGGLLQLNVGPGTYFIQVGGFGSGAGASDGTLTFTALFDPDLDVDDDNHARPADCNDNNPAVHPGARDVTNGIDDNCDGIVDPDRDDDKVARPPLGNDCNDADPRVHPGARDVRGNRVDENCDGRLAPWRRIRAQVNPTGAALSNATTILSFTVGRLPDNARVHVQCLGPRRGGRRRQCGGGVKTSKRVSFKSLVGRTLPVGSVIRVTVTKPRFIGFHQAFTVRARKPLRASKPRCINEGDRRRRPRAKCPGVG